MILTYKFNLIPDDAFNISIREEQPSPDRIVGALLKRISLATDYREQVKEIFLKYVKARSNYPTDREALPMIAELVEMEVGKRTVVMDPSGAEAPMGKLMEEIYTLTKDQFIQLEAMVEQCNITIWYAIDYVKTGIFSAHPNELDDRFVEYVKDKKIGAQDVSEDLEGYVDWERYAHDYLENECETALVNETETVVIESYALRTNE